MADEKDLEPIEIDAIDAYLSGQGPPVDVYAGAPVKSIPFPPEVVERAYRLHFDAIRERVPLEKQVDEVLSVIAEYLRSDEVRRRVAKAVQLEAADAVIAAMLGEKT